MGVLSRKRSLLIKLVVIVSTAWFTIAFLLYSESRTDDAPISLALQSNNAKSGDFHSANEVDSNDFDKEEVVEEPKNDIDEAVLKPQPMAGEMGKPVVLPANLTGKFSLNC